MKALTDVDIRDKAKKYNIKLNGIYNRNNIPDNLASGWYILNLDLKGAGGTHWTAFCINNGGKADIYFDSFGVLPPHDLSRHLGHYAYNVKIIQDPMSHSCGWFALMCIFACQNTPHEKPFEKFIKDFSSNTDVNELLLDKFWSKYP